MTAEPYMRPGQRPARARRDWSLLVPVAALAAALLVALVGVLVLL